MLTHVKIVLLWADSTAAYPQQPISKMWVTWVALAFDGSRDYSSWDAEAGGCRTVMRLHQISYSSVLHGKNTQLYSALCNVVIEKTMIRNVTTLHGAVYFGWLMSHSDAQRGVASPRRQFIHNNLTAHSFDCTFDYTTRGWAWRHRTDGPTGIGPYLAKDATSPLLIEIYYAKNWSLKAFRIHMTHCGRQTAAAAVVLSFVSRLKLL